MSFPINSHIDLTTSRIETTRCVLVPFSLDGRMDVQELTEEFCKANKDLFVSPFLPNYEQELDYIKSSESKIEKWQEFENFVFDKYTMRFIGCGGIRILETGEPNIGIWIRVDEHSKWYATEVYMALIDWARTNVRYRHLRHALDPRNTASRKLAIKFGGILQQETNERGDEIYHIPF